jgi:hypothetical protein
MDGERQTNTRNKALYVARRRLQLLNRSKGLGGGVKQSLEGKRLLSVSISIRTQSHKPLTPFAAIPQFFTTE